VHGATISDVRRGRVPFEDEKWLKREAGQPVILAEIDRGGIVRRIHVTCVVVALVLRNLSAEMDAARERVDDGIWPHRAPPFSVPDL
jgi:hypothetical protein